jgi:hypothetical protein
MDQAENNFRFLKPTESRLGKVGCLVGTVDALWTDLSLTSPIEPNRGRRPVAAFGVIPTDLFIDASNRAPITPKLEVVYRLFLYLSQSKKRHPVTE